MVPAGGEPRSSNAGTAAGNREKRRQARALHPRSPRNFTAPPVREVRREVSIHRNLSPILAAEGTRCQAGRHRAAWHEVPPFGSRSSVEAHQHGRFVAAASFLCIGGSACVSFPHAGRKVTAQVIPRYETQPHSSLRTRVRRFERREA